MFFPNPIFGWAFYAVLIVFLAVASYTDFTRITIPKGLTVLMLGVGVVFNVVRGAWLGARDVPVWQFHPSPWLGAVDGLLFALAGFGLCLLVFVGLWVLGIAGGGDVKLFAALGGWLGPRHFFLVLLGTGVAIVVISFVALLRKLIRQGPRKVFAGIHANPSKGKKKPLPIGAQKRGRLITYSFPVALSTALLLPVMFREEMFRADLLPVPPKGDPEVSARE